MHPLRVFFPLLFAISWIAGFRTDGSTEDGRRRDAVSCMPMETTEAFRMEAVTGSFSMLHPTPKAANDAERLGKSIRFKGSDGVEAGGYFIASKKRSKRWLIVIQEWWGLNENIREEADRYFTDLGDMNVIAVDMYDGKVAETPDSAMKIMRSVDQKRLRAIIEGAIGHAGPDASIYSVGWCFGGMWSLQTAIIAGPKAKGTVMFYGRPETDAEKLKSIRCDVIGFFGNLDSSPSPAMVSAFEEGMRNVGKNLVTHKYEAGHGFANPSNPKFNKEATADSYAKAIAFLKSH
jgi:carboxymethylenebutenolidase